MSRFKKNICLVTVSLSVGGAEKSTAMLSQILHSLGYNVFVVTLLNNVEYEFEGELLNLGQHKALKNNRYKRIMRFKLFRNFLVNNEIDVVIDNRTHQLAFRELFYLYYIYRGIDLIYVIRSFYLQYYFPKLNFVSKLMRKKSKKLISVSDSIRHKVLQKFPNTDISTIYNPICSHTLKNEINSDEGYILYFGRIVDEVKNISHLINSYLNSKICRKHKIKIYGEGKDKVKLQKYVKELDLEDYILFFPFTNEIISIISNAKFTVLTSHFEGFPRCLIESLAIGVPVVSVNCAGVDEIVKNEYNGLLVENYNEAELSRALFRMYDDQKLYNKCKENSISSVMHLNLNEIGKKWDELINQL